MNVNFHNTGKPTKRRLIASDCVRMTLQTVLLCVGCNAWGIGTDAGVAIENTASADFSIAGNVQAPIFSNTVQTIVDELLDAVVVDDNGGPVLVTSGASGAVLQFTVTNNGNGDEVFRIVADDAVAEGGFDPVVTQIYIESNGLPGLQVGGDTPYVTGIADPLLAEDESIVVYVVSDIPTATALGDAGDVALRAVAETVFSQAATDDPDNPAWPTPGTSYAGAGDGGGNAVVGSAQDIANLLMRTNARYEIANAVVAISKSASAVVDPFGGATVVPGSVITYELSVTVSGVGSVDGLVIADVLPIELDFVPGTLIVDGVADDDDFVPAGADGAGYDTPIRTVRVDRGTVLGGSSAIVISFDAAVR